MWDLDGFSYIGFYPWLVFLRDLRYDTTYAGYKMISIEIYIYMYNSPKHRSRVVSVEINQHKKNTLGLWGFQHPGKNLCKSGYPLVN